MKKNTMGCSPHADVPNNNENNVSHKSSSHGWVHVNIQESTNHLLHVCLCSSIDPHKMHTKHVNLS